MVNIGGFVKGLTQFGRDIAPLAAAAAGAQSAQGTALQRISAGLSAIPRTAQGQATAIAVPQAPPAETAFSGEITAAPMRAQVPQRPQYMDGIQTAAYVPSAPARGASIQPAGLPAVVGGGVAVGRGMMNMLGIAGGAITVAPLIIDPFTGEEKKLRVTRKLKSQVRKAVEMFGVEFVADQMGVDAEVVFYILTKRMRNDGPYVTKAAVRKTRQTVRKMKNLCDMYDDLRPAAKRRAPAARRATTRITNVK